MSTCEAAAFAPTSPPGLGKAKALIITEPDSSKIGNMRQMFLKRYIARYDDEYDFVTPFTGTVKFKYDPSSTETDRVKTFTDRFRGFRFDLVVVFCVRMGTYCFDVDKLVLYTDRGVPKHFSILEKAGSTVRFRSVGAKAWLSNETAKLMYSVVTIVNVPFEFEMTLPVRPYQISPDNNRCKEFRIGVELHVGMRMPDQYYVDVQRFVVAWEGRADSFDHSFYFLYEGNAARPNEHNTKYAATLTKLYRQDAIVNLADVKDHECVVRSLGMLVLPTSHDRYSLLGRIAMAVAVPLVYVKKSYADCTIGGDRLLSRADSVEGIFDKINLKTRAHVDMFNEAEEIRRDVNTSFATRPGMEWL